MRLTKPANWRRSMSAAARGMVKHPIEPWFAPFALVNASALVPILLKLVAVRHGLGQVGLVMGAFYLGAAAWTWFAQALRERLIT